MADSFAPGRLTEPSEIWSAFFPSTTPSADPMPTLGGMASLLCTSWQQNSKAVLSQCLFCCPLPSPFYSILCIIIFFLLYFLGPQLTQWRGWPQLVVKFFAHDVSHEIRKYSAWYLVPAIAWLLQKPGFILWASDLPLLSLQNIFILCPIPSGSYPKHSSYLVPLFSPSYGAYQWVIQTRSKLEYKK